MVKLFTIIVWITIHFGRNPIKGGSPPSDKRVVNNMNLMDDFLFPVITWLMNEILNNLVIVVMVSVSSEYTIKYNTHKLSPPAEANNIHPV